MTASQVKGWCPGAHRPMMSGDGLIVRVRPRLGRLTHSQMLGLCDVASLFGNGVIDLTSRANLQIRGICEDEHILLLKRLGEIGVLDEDPGIEARRNILTTPLWRDGDLTTRLHAALCERLLELPVMPAKTGYAIDTGHVPVLAACSTDFRFEKGAETPLILRLDGLKGGRAVTENNAINALIEMAEWFIASGGLDAGRMARHVAVSPPPPAWTAQAPATGSPDMEPGPTADGFVYGAPFGTLDAQLLAELLRDSTATAIRCTPWRLFLLEAAQPCASHGFVTSPGDPMITLHACPGAPACASATVDTRSVARALAALGPKGLHVSGCSKGCAHPRAAAITLVGRDGAYDLVTEGHSWDQPRQFGLTTRDVMMLLD